MSRHTPPTPYEQRAARDRLIQVLYAQGTPYLVAVDQVDSILDRTSHTWPAYDTTWPYPYVPSTQRSLT